ncbi:hypothetical protein L0F63_006400 [Massospora cicadina]|nr:hypothetical protein L0F63_006400 [Massospora cicadina]
MAGNPAKEPAGYAKRASNTTNETTLGYPPQAMKAGTTPQPGATSTIASSPDRTSATCTSNSSVCAASHQPAGPPPTKEAITHAVLMASAQLNATQLIQAFTSPILSANSASSIIADALFLAPSLRGDTQLPVPQTLGYWDGDETSPSFQLAGVNSNLDGPPQFSEAQQTAPKFNMTPATAVTFQQQGNSANLSKPPVHTQPAIAAQSKHKRTKGATGAWQKPLAPTLPKADPRELAFIADVKKKWAKTRAQKALPRSTLSHAIRLYYGHNPIKFYTKDYFLYFAAIAETVPINTTIHESVEGHYIDVGFTEAALADHADTLQVIIPRGSLCISHTRSHLEKISWVTFSNLPTTFDPESLKLALHSGLMEFGSVLSVDFSVPSYYAPTQRARTARASFIPSPTVSRNIEVIPRGAVVGACPEIFLSTLIRRAPGVHGVTPLDTSTTQGPKPGQKRSHVAAAAIPQPTQWVPVQDLSPEALRLAVETANPTIGMGYLRAHAPLPMGTPSNLPEVPLVSHPHSVLRGTPTNLNQRFIASTLSSQWSYATSMDWQPAACGRSATSKSPTLTPQSISRGSFAVLEEVNMDSDSSNGDTAEVTIEHPQVLPLQRSGGSILGWLTGSSAPHPLLPFRTLDAPHGLQLIVKLKDSKLAASQQQV